MTCGGLEQVLGADSPVVAHFRALMASAGVADGFCMFAQDAEGRSVTIAAPARASLAPGPRVRGIWRRIGLHLVAGLRLRRKLEAHSTQRAALLSPSGSIEDACETVANDGAGRRALADVVRAMDRARGSKVRDSPERAIERWRGLVAGNTAGDWERFVLIDLNGGELSSGDKVRLRAQNGKFVTAAQGQMKANRDVGSTWETFTITKLPRLPTDPVRILTNDRITLRAWDNRWVCAERGGGHEVKADRPAAAEWETFTFTVRSRSTRDPSDGDAECKRSVGRQMKEGAAHIQVALAPRHEEHG